MKVNQVLSIRLHSPVLLLIAFSVGMCGLWFPAGARGDTLLEPQTTQSASSSSKKPSDRSGHKRVGNASVYAKKFAGRTMADGTTMDAHGDNAASKTLPLGTIAKVTNIGTGKSALVTIRDRGPYVKDRIIDLSPSTAQKIGISQNEGVSKVEVMPIKVPQKDDNSKRTNAMPAAVEP